MPKTLITDSDKDTSTYNPNKPTYFRMRPEDNPNTRDPRALRESTKCGKQGLQTDSTVSIQKAN